MVGSSFVKYIEMSAGLINHHGIVPRNGQAIHITGTSVDRAALKDVIIKNDPYKEFSKTYNIDMRVVKRLLGGESRQVEESARSCLGIKGRFELASFNCKLLV